MFENLVYQKLRKTNKDIYYWKDQLGREVDCVILKDNKVDSLYQVCFDISDQDTLKREVKRLLKAKKILNCSNLNLIIFEKPEFFKELKEIKVITASEFF